MRVNTAYGIGETQEFSGPGCPPGDHEVIVSLDGGSVIILPIEQVSEIAPGEDEMTKKKKSKK